ncbi:hypothetical protein JCM24511_09150 [Saitozyma sp. JCM 24511]|nr:hypothetical protein JCM24511_09150 [Saitozyma sp. JCM 24511]
MSRRLVGLGLIRRSRRYEGIWWRALGPDVRPALPEAPAGELHIASERMADDKGACDEQE